MGSFLLLPSALTSLASAVTTGPFSSLIDTSDGAMAVQESGRLSKPLCGGTVPSWAASGRCHKGWQSLRLWGDQGSSS